MYVTAALTPPLASSTVVDSSEAVRFVACLEVAEEPANIWIVELWYGYNDTKWQSAAFTPATSSELTLYDTRKQPRRRKCLYTLTLNSTGNPNPLQFTLRFKPENSRSWIWIRSQNQLGDGQIIFRRPEATASVTFDSLFSGPDSALSAKKINASVQGVELFDVQSEAPALNDEWSTTNMGIPLSLEHFYALVKIRAPWMGPRQGSFNFDVDSDSLLAGWLRSDGRHVVVLAVSGLGFTTNYIRSKNGRVLLKARNDSGKPQSHRALVATGLDWHSATGAAFDAARTLLRQWGVTEENAPPEMDPLWRESWYDGLGYCTWNSLGRELTQGRVLDALQDLHDKGVFVSTVIIDDNWQSLDAKRRWDKFEANEHFPNGLKGLTSEIRRRFKHIAHIAVWHAIVGYWEGVSPDGWIASNYKCTTIKWRGGHKVTVVDETDVNRMYNDFYSFLKSSGVDSVKCDVQSALSDFDHAVDRKRLGHAYQDAFKVNGLRYFQARVIYCMAMIPDTFFHSLLQHHGPVVLLRNSDDFYPDIPDSHPWHLFCNAMNNIYTSFLNVLPDWDMFQTSLPEYAGLHAAGRCISGGCIYITDTPGKHSLPLIEQMGATSIRTPERLVALRPAAASIPLDPYIGYNSNRLLKVCSIYGAVSMMAIFNVSTNENSELVSLREFKDVLVERHYVVRAQTTGEVFGPATTVSDGVLVSLTLQVAGWELLSAVPVTKRGDFDVGVIGLISQLAGAAAVTQSWIGDDGTLTKVQVQLKALGTLGFYVSNLEDRSINDMFVILAGFPVPVHTVRKSKSDKRVLEVDVVAAWKELGLQTKWSNEVALQFFL